MHNFFVKTLILILTFNISCVFAQIEQSACGCLKTKKNYPIFYQFQCCKYKLKSEGKNGSYYQAFFGSSKKHTLVDICNPPDFPDIIGTPDNNCTKSDKVINDYKFKGSKSIYNSSEEACQLIPNDICSKDKVRVFYYKY